VPEAAPVQPAPEPVAEPVAVEPVPEAAPVQPAPEPVAEPVAVEPLPEAAAVQPVPEPPPAAPVPQQAPVQAPAASAAVPSPAQVPPVAAAAGATAVRREPLPASVSGHLAKLEQQAQRATARLEEKLDEAESRLQNDVEASVSKISTREQDSLTSVNSRRDILSARLKVAGEQVQEGVLKVSAAGCQTINESLASATETINQTAASLSLEVLQSFDELVKGTEGLASTYVEKAGTLQQQGLAELNQALLADQSKFEEIRREFQASLQSNFDLLEKRLSELNQAGVAELSVSCDRLKSELLLYKSSCLKRLDDHSSELVGTVSENVSSCQAGIQMHSDSVGANALLPRLMTLRQSFGETAQMLREKYKEEVERSATLKFVELRPVLLSSREEMEAIVLQARELRTAIEVGQRAEFEKSLESLAQFVEEKIAEAKVHAELNLEELAKIEQSVFALSDATAIESDPELSAARTRVLARLQEIGAQLQERVNETLRRQIAGMEDKGRMLQEELISSMESSAYAVRKSVESSLGKIKQAIADADAAIQELQNQYL
jgi:hypothetical protein